MAAILARSLRTGELSQDDRQYLSQVVASYTDMSPAQAEQRVNQAHASLEQAVSDAGTAAREAADTARQAAAATTLWLFVVFLAGAFAASFLATLGGRQRDAVHLTDENSAAYTSHTTRG